MFSVADINQLHQTTVDRWHSFEIDNSYEGILATVCKQHSFNFLLWHEEDIARSRDVSDAKIADVKRAIDRYNQQRNDWIEKVDDQISAMLTANEIQHATDAVLNTETPGSAIDRLSIMALRVYHLEEQLQRTDVNESHRQSVEQKLAVCLMQQADLSGSLQMLLDDIFAGKKIHQTYRQFKMYNDPALNPYLYKAKVGHSKAGHSKAA